MKSELEAKSEQFSCLVILEVHKHTLKGTFV